MGKWKIKPIRNIILTVINESASGTQFKLTLNKEQQPSIQVHGLEGW